MSTWSKSSNYYSGQGVCLLGTRDASGKPVRLTPIGNVSSLKTTIATTVVEHYEAQSGARGLDLRLTTKITATMAVVMENYIASNLAIALRGTATPVLASSVTSESHAWYNGVVAMDHLQVSAVTLTTDGGSTTLTPYVNATTNWDYKINLAAGSVLFNDGSTPGYGFDQLTIGSALSAPTAVAVSASVGAPTIVTVANSCNIGDFVVFSGFSGANAAAINGIAIQVGPGSTSASLHLILATHGLTITLGTPLMAAEGQTLVNFAYTYAGQQLIDSLSIAATDYYLRFEGLNTANGNQSVVVEVFRFSSDPLKELDLISDTVQQFTMDGSVLQDALQPTGSQYFKVTTLQ